MQCNGRGPTAHFSTALEGERVASIGHVGESDLYSDAMLVVTCRIGGQRSHVTRLVQQLLPFLEAHDYPRVDEVVALKGKVNTAHTRCVEVVKEFLASLDMGSCRYKEYTEQLCTKNEELKQPNLRIANFILEGIDKGSIALSGKSDRVRTVRLVYSGSTLFSAARLRLNVRLAEMRLQQV